MHSAPAVTVRCTGGLLWRSGHWLLPAVAAAAFTGWASLHVIFDHGWHGGWAVVPAATAFAVAVVWAQRQLPRPAQLVWDGAQWTCEGLPVRPQVMMDSGVSWMLLRLWPIRTGEVVGVRELARPAGPVPTWLAVHQRDAGTAWPAFRTAVYCPPPYPAPRGSTHPPP